MGFKLATLSAIRAMSSPSAKRRSRARFPTLPAVAPSRILRAFAEPSLAGTEAVVQAAVGQGPPCGRVEAVAGRIAAAGELLRHPRRASARACTAATLCGFTLRPTAP